MRTALQCFLHETLRGSELPVYDVERRGLGIVGKRPEELPRMKDGRVIVPLAEHTAKELEQLAWDLLLYVARTRLKVEPWDVRRAFTDFDIPFRAYVERDGIKLAVTDPEYFARYPEKGGKTGLLIFNPRGVFEIDLKKHN